VFGCAFSTRSDDIIASEICTAMRSDPHEKVGHPQQKSTSLAAHSSSAPSDGAGCRFSKASCLTLPSPASDQDDEEDGVRSIILKPVNVRRMKSKPSDCRIKIREEVLLTSPAEPEWTIRSPDR
jgi:hypothetical protein